METKRIGIRQVCRDVAEGLSGEDRSATTIRCTINDALDALERDGHKVSYDYNQPRAVATVKRLLIERMGVA